MAEKTEPNLLGPSGGTGGEAFYAAMPPTCVKILRVFGRAQNRIDQIGVEWLTDNGSTIRGGPFGGRGGTEFDFEISGEGEYLTQIYGTVVDYNSLRIASLRFVTNKNNISGTYGIDSNFPFYFMAPLGVHITGILGRAGLTPDSEVDALGCYMDLLG